MQQSLPKQISIQGWTKYLNVYNLLFIWILVQALLFNHSGVVTILEADKYITEAHYFIDGGKFYSPNYWLYSTEIFLIVAALKLHISFVVIVIIQLLVNLVATLLFYKLALNFLQNSVLTFLATFFLIINIPYQVYNTYLFTESLFYSLSIIFSCHLLLMKKLTIKTVSLLFILLLILCITRPTGILFLPAASIYLFFRFFNNISVSLKLLILSGALILFLFILNKLLGIGGSLDFMWPFRTENIICGVPTTEVDIKALPNGNSLAGLLYYIIHNPQQFLRLAWLKTISFFGLYRPYYSKLHNVFLMAFFYPFYLLSIIGVIKNFKYRKYPVIYILMIATLFWVTTLLTCDDWHNRFVLTITPWLFLLGMSTFKNTTSKQTSLS